MVRKARYVYVGITCTPGHELDTLCSFYYKGLSSSLLLSFWCMALFVSGAILVYDWFVSVAKRRLHSCQLITYIKMTTCNVGLGGLTTCTNKRTRDMTCT